MAAKLTGTFSVTPSQGVEPLGSTGCSYGLSLLTSNQAPTKENSSGLGTIDSSGSFVALPIDTDMRGQVFYIRTNRGGSSPGPVDIRLTQLATGTTVIKAVKGVFVVEVDSTEAITLVELQGVANFEWALTGLKA